VKPFLLLATRVDDAIAAAEYAAFLRLGRLQPHELRRIRLERDPMPTLDLRDYSGIFVGGSPFNASDDPEAKPPVQRRVESEMSRLLDIVIERDYPFFGACYGVGTLGVHQGAVIDRRFGEAVGAVEITLTAAGRNDALFADLPDRFHAFVGHKEACSALPPSAVLLAGSMSCPIQAFRVGRNAYATQFHPELEVADLIARVRAYRHEGYFAPHELEETEAAVHAGPPVTWPSRLLRAFVDRYASSASAAP
jgi:GMP synthase - Glutamine amidotransferase domain